MTSKSFTTLLLCCLSIAAVQSFSPNYNNNNIHQERIKSASSFNTRRKRFQPQLFVSTLRQEQDTTILLEESATIDYNSRQQQQQQQGRSSLSSQSIIIQENTDDDDNEEYQRGLMTIGFITLLFASNSPALHAAFTSFDSPPPVLLVNAIVSLLALVGLLSGGSTLESNTPLPSSLVQVDSENNNNKNSILQGGMELGFWKFFGTTANLAGLSLTTASHGAFLIQLTTLIVPVVQGIQGVPIPRRVQYSVGLALAGVFCFCTGDAVAGGEGGVVDAELLASSSLGDALCVLAAVFYATYDLRLFEWGKQVPARELITTKIGTQAILSLILLLTFGFTETQEYIRNLMMESSTTTVSSFASDNNNMILLPLLLLWSGVAVNAVAPFLQVGGQQAVGPTKCQTIYASQPLWAGIMSYLCLGETFGTQALVGGGAFLVALYLAATAENNNDDDDDSTKQ